MDLNLDLDMSKKLASGFDLDLDLSNLTGFGFDLDLRGWRICTPLHNQLGLLNKLCVLSHLARTFCTLWQKNAHIIFHV